MSAVLSRAVLEESAKNPDTYRVTELSNSNSISHLENKAATLLGEFQNNLNDCTDTQASELIRTTTDLCSAVAGNFQTGADISGRHSTYLLAAKVSGVLALSFPDKPGILKPLNSGIKELLTKPQAGQPTVKAF